MSQSTKSTTLTNKLVKSLPTKEKVYEVRDSELKGFLVRVHPTGNKTYRCEYKRGKHMTLGRANVLTATQAREQVKQIIGDAARGIDPRELERQKQAAERLRANQLTLKEFMQRDYIPWYKAAYVKTWESMAKDIERNFYPDFGEMLLAEMTQKMIEKWRIKRGKMTRTRHRQGKIVEELISPATINRNVEKLNAVFNKAVEFGVLENNPIAKIKKLKVEQPNRVRFLTEAELAHLLQALDEREARIRADRDRGNAWRQQRHRELLPDLNKMAFADYLKPMVLISLGSGIRFGSLVRLEWHRHINQQKKNIVIQLTPDIVKTSKGYDVPLDKATSKVVQDWYQQTEQQHQGKGWVFPGRDPAKHITTVRKSWVAVLEAAHIEDFHWHDQRHDYASQHVMSGTDLYTVMELLGHSDPKMTKKYAHLAAEHKIQAAEKLAARRKNILEN